MLGCDPIHQVSRQQIEPLGIVDDEYQFLFLSHGLFCDGQHLGRFMCRVEVQHPVEGAQRHRFSGLGAARLPYC